MLSIFSIAFTFQIEPKSTAIVNPYFSLRRSTLCRRFASILYMNGNNVSSFAFTSSLLNRSRFITEFALMPISLYRLPFKYWLYSINALNVEVLFPFRFNARTPSKIGFSPITENSPSINFFKNRSRLAFVLVSLAVNKIGVRDEMPSIERLISFSTICEK